MADLERLRELIHQDAWFMAMLRPPSTCGTRRGLARRLEDLFGLILRRNPARVSLEEFHRRLESKRIRERWPRVTIIDG